MLVALSSSTAFGVLVYSAIAPERIVALLGLTALLSAVFQLGVGFAGVVTLPPSRNSRER